MSEPLEVMIVDDDMDDVDFLQSAFAKHPADFRFVVHPNGQLAIDYLHGIKAQSENRTYPHVIFLDLHMPGKNGYLTLQEIRSEAAFHHIPVMILSTTMMPDAEQKCLNLGCNGYYVKPNSLDEYDDTIEKTVALIQAKAI